MQAHNPRETVLLAIVLPPLDGSINALAQLVVTGEIGFAAAVEGLTERLDAAAMHAISVMTWSERGDQP